MLRFFLIGLIKLYRYSFAYFFRGACRFQPSCSEYAELALRRHGVMIGVWLTLKRLLHCHPFKLPIKFLSSGSGYDPVPKNYPKNFLNNFFKNFRSK